MPFYSQDWRSPGEKWVKTDDGWEQKKILDCKSPLPKRSDKIIKVDDPSCESKENQENIGSDKTEDYKWMNNQGDGDSDDNENLKMNYEQEIVQPHCPITRKCTKEIAGFNGLSDALQRLDFLNAVHDTRRFGYVCKLLEELLSKRLASLSGCARRVILATLEEVACEVSASQNNLHLLQQLLGQLRKANEWKCWGHPQGSTSLWTQHQQTIHRILNIAGQINIIQPTTGRMQTLPEECIREILLRLSNHKDVENAAESYSVMKRIADEQRIWRELCVFHFPQAQVNAAVNEYNTQVDWQNIFHKLRRVHGLRETYAETLSLCRHCSCLFWHSIGHPCIVQRDVPDIIERFNDTHSSVPIPPRAFLNFFSL